MHPQERVRAVTHRSASWTQLVGLGLLCCLLAVSADAQTSRIKRISLMTPDLDQSIAFFTGVIGFKLDFEGTLPQYLSDVLVTRKPPKSVRSSSVKRLHPPLKPKRAKAGGRSFRHVAPAVWYLLPTDIQSSPFSSEFKSKLKLTYSRNPLASRLGTSHVLKDYHRFCLDGL